MSRTPKALMVLRVAKLPWMLILWGGMLGGMIPGFGVLFIVIAAVAAMMICFSIILRIFGHVVHGNDPNYQQFIKSGGDPYFDLTLPPGINNDSWAVRCGGKSEPDAGFVPPKDWLWQCNACGARNEAPDGACWNCGSSLSNGPTNETVGPKPSMNRTAAAAIVANRFTLPLRP